MNKECTCCYCCTHAVIQVLCSGRNIVSCKSPTLEMIVGCACMCVNIRGECLPLIKKPRSQRCSDHNKIKQ